MVVTGAVGDNLAGVLVRDNGMKQSEAARANGSLSSPVTAQRSGTSPIRAFCFLKMGDPATCLCAVGYDRVEKDPRLMQEKKARIPSGSTE